MITNIDIPVSNDFSICVTKIYNPSSKNADDLLYFPGIASIYSSDAKLFNNLIGFRNIYVIHPRGRGLSSTKTKDYSLERHARDILTIVNFLKVEKFTLICYSYACIYGIYFTSSLKHTGVPLPKKLFLCDFPAKESRLDLSWVDFMEKNYSHLPRTFFESFAQSSSDRDLYNLIDKIDIPIVLFKAGNKSYPNSFLSDQDMIRYRDSAKNLTVEQFSSGHFFKDQETEKFREKITELS